MTRLYSCGWESGGFEEAMPPSSRGTWEVNSSIKHSGDYSFHINPTGTDIGFMRCLPNDTLLNEPSAVCSFYFRPELLPAANNEEIAVVWNTAVGEAWEQIRINSTGNLGIFAQNGTQIGSYGSTTLVTGAWYRIDYQFIQTTNGYTLKIDGATELSGTSAALARTNTGCFSVGKTTNRNGNSVDFYYDDAVIDSDTFPGEREIIRLNVDGDGTYTDILGTTPHWQQIDESPYSIVDYLETDRTVGHAGTFGCETCANAGINAGTINSAQIVAVAHRVDYDPSAKFRIRSGSTNLDSTNLIACGLSNYWQLFNFMVVQDPATSAAWTMDGLDAAEIGVVENNAGAAHQICAIYLMVEFTVSTGMGQVI